jgi:phosphoglycolate phosphatase
VFVVGWDLDMTLVDSRPGIAATLHELARETTTPIDVDLVVSRLGVTLDEELAEWVPTEHVAAAADRFRELYVDHGVSGTFLMPGAADAVDAVRDAGGRNIVVTAKYEPNAIACLAHVGLTIDTVIGWRHGPTKGTTLAEHGAAIYVGDTPSDILGAHSGGALAVAVASGPHPVTALRDAGADVVLESLVAFPDWLSSRRSRG